MKRNDYIIGVLGGMGTYATIHLFQQYAKLFPAEKEWERPRLIIDNRCTMPSRVRAFLYNENVEQLVDEMAESMKNLVDVGCNRIILDCNTSHLFLPLVYKKVPGLKGKVVHIIQNCVNQISKQSIREVYILGTEGTIESKIYQDAFEGMSIKCFAPSQDEYYKLRFCIEAVKQNKYTEKAKDTFLELTNRYENCILGCTEFPILFEKYGEGIKGNIYDPLYMALKYINEEYTNLHSK